jgi:hypothetical protein
MVELTVTYGLQVGVSPAGAAGAAAGGTQCTTRTNQDLGLDAY